MKETVRAHILLPRPLVEALDRLVGQRQRSRFVEAAIEEKMAREQQRQALQALREAGGVLKSSDYPHWVTPEQTSQWVHDLRQQADAQTRRKPNRVDDSSA